MPSPSAPVRTLFVIDELDIGGTEQQIFELVTRLDRRRYIPLVCCFRPGRVSAEIEAAGVPVFVLPKRAVFDVRLVWQLVQLMRRERLCQSVCELGAADAAAKSNDGGHGCA